MSSTNQRNRKVRERYRPDPNGPPKDLHGSHTGHGCVYVVIDDIDIHYAQVKSAGTSRLGESHDSGDGYRGYSARDLGGNLRSFGTGPVP
jgi:hypothetical protein